ncbi:MAG: hypothetical protein EXS25_10765 [Pedosphaera sp.]|nr:hypothetical protein [Pedosphaera sp.]
MKSDPLKQFVTLLETLLAEKMALEERLEQINQALGISVSELTQQEVLLQPLSASRSKEPSVSKSKRSEIAEIGKSLRISKTSQVSKRRSNDGRSLKQILIDLLTEKKSLTRQEILQAVIEGGYKFSAADPLNSLSTLIYSNRKIFSAKKGSISLV